MCLHLLKHCDLHPQPDLRNPAFIVPQTSLKLGIPQLTVGDWQKQCLCCQLAIYPTAHSDIQRDMWAQTCIVKCVWGGVHMHACATHVAVQVCVGGVQRPMLDFLLSHSLNLVCTN